MKTKKTRQLNATNPCPIREVSPRTLRRVMGGFKAEPQSKDWIDRVK